MSMKKRQLPAMIASLLIIPLAGQSAEWTTNKSVEVSSTYSDNSGLASGGGGQSETVIQVRPSLGISGEGARMNLNFNYSLGAVFTDGKNGRDDIEDSHFLNARAEIEAIEDNLFLDIDANAGISSVSSTAVVASDINTRSSNTTQTFSIKLSPYAKYRFGSYADALLRYSADSLANQSNSNDSENSSWDLSLTSGKRFTAYSWVFSANQSELKNKNGPTDETSRLNLDMQYRINRKFTADFGIGHEENDYQNALRQYGGDTDGMTWDVGTTWTPNPRTTFQLSYGDRFTGEDWAMSLDYRHRKSTLKASYNTSVTNSRSEQIETLSVLARDINGDPIFIGGQQLYLNVIQPTLSSENIVQSQFKLAYQYQSRRTSVGVDFAFAERSYQTQTLSTEDMTTALNISHKLTPVSSLTSRISWVTRDDLTAVSDQELLSWSLGLSSSLGANSTLALNYQYSENEDSTGANSYEENRVQASLAMSF